MWYKIQLSLIVLNFVVFCGWKRQSTLEAHCFKPMAEVLLTWSRFSIKYHLFLALSYLKITTILCLFLVLTGSVILFPRKRRWDYQKIFSGLVFLRASTGTFVSILSHPPRTVLLLVFNVSQDYCHILTPLRKATAKCLYSR